MSLATQVLLGLGLGVATGLFFGQDVSFFDVPGRAFVLLLQMTVLPYVAVSMVGGIGRLGAGGARSLARNAGGFLLLLWALAITAVLLMPIAFPKWEAASFFDPSLVVERESVDFLSLYIPANPFESLARGVVPAVVIFSIALGLGLIAVERKGPLLESLMAIEDALLQVTNGIVRLAPFGVFAITANAAGTLDFESFQDLQVYALAYAGLAAVLTLFALPGLVAVLTPFGYRELLGPSRDAIVTAFATGSLFVVLPILATRGRELVRTKNPDAERTVDVVVPISFTLASSGKLLSLGFVLFAGWMSGFPVSVAEYPTFVATGILSFFASTFVGVPFLLDLFRIPADTFGLFVISDNVVGNRFGSALASVHTLVLAVLTASAAGGLVRLRRGRLLAWLAVSLALMLGTVAGVRLLFETVDRPYVGYQKFVDRGLLLPAAPDRATAPRETPAAAGPTLSRIRQRGVLRAGFAKDSLPYAFANGAGERVGFDVEMAHALARDLGVGIAFVQIERGQAPARLADGTVDVLMTGFVVTPERAERMSFSEPYMDVSMALIVRDYRRHEVANLDKLRRLEGLRLAIPTGGYYENLVRERLPRAEVVRIETARAFFRDDDGSFDALVLSAEAGTAWTLVYPEFGVVVPQPRVLRVPLSYAVALGDRGMTDLLNAWIDLKQRDGTIQRLFDYWFEGRIPHEDHPRWSILRDVLGWGA